VNFSQLWLFVADWFGTHSAPTIAGFIGGLVAVEVRERWRARKEKQRAVDDRG